MAVVEGQVQLLFHPVSVAHDLGPDGLIAAQHARYEDRESQRAMAATIAQLILLIVISPLAKIMSKETADAGLPTARGLTALGPGGWGRGCRYYARPCRWSQYPP